MDLYEVQGDSVGRERREPGRTPPDIAGGRSAIRFTVGNDGQYTMESYAEKQIMKKYYENKL